MAVPHDCMLSFASRLEEIGLFHCFKYEQYCRQKTNSRRLRPTKNVLQHDLSLREKPTNPSN